MRQVALSLIAACLTAVGVAPVAAQTRVGVSIDVRQPGVYGRINIGAYPEPPVLVAPQPVIIAPPPVAVPRQPIYLYVPVEHQRNWRRYCGRYAACGQPVYFVQDRWVRDRYEHAHPGWERGRHGGRDWHDRDRGRGRGHDHDGRGRGHDHEGRGGDHRH